MLSSSGPRPSAASTREALAAICTPAPISCSAGAWSQIVTSKPLRRRLKPAARPPMPAPAMRMVGRSGINPLNYVVSVQGVGEPPDAAGPLSPLAPLGRGSPAVPQSESALTTKVPSLRMDDALPARLGEEALECHRAGRNRWRGWRDAGEWRCLREPFLLRRQAPRHHPLRVGRVPAHGLDLDVHRLIVGVEQLDAVAVRI